MTRCPNCGSAIRIGAKFCTSCGFRLTVDEPVTASQVAPSRSPFSTTSTPAWSAGPAEVATPVDAMADPSQSDDIEPAWAKADDGDAPEVADGEVDDEVIEFASSDSGDDVVVAGDHAAEGLVKDEEPEPSWFIQPGQDTSGPVSDDMIAVLEGDRADQPQTDVAAETDDDGSVAIASEPTPEALRTTYTWNAGDQQITAVRDTSVAHVSAGMPTGSTAVLVDGDPLAEARSLVGRLGDVLASVQLGSGSGATGRPAPTSVADESDVEALRSIVKSAQERPRDVDVMLDLVLRADTISAVLTDRDLLLAALRGDEGGVEESGAAEDDETSTYPAWRALP